MASPTASEMNASGSGNSGRSMLHTLKQAWWAPLVVFLVICELWLAVVFVVGNGTSNVLDAEGTVAGVTLAVSGAASLVLGLWSRPKSSWFGSGLIIVGAALSSIWFWTVIMTPVAIAVIVGVVVSQVRTPPRVRGDVTVSREASR